MAATHFFTEVEEECQAKLSRGKHSYNHVEFISIDIFRYQFMTALVIVVRYLPIDLGV
jgi:hypothetical protein